MLIEMDGFSVILQRKPVKNINLRIRQTGEIQLSAPLRAPLHTIYDFLHDKRPWIVMHQQRLQTLEPKGTRNLITGESVFFQGQRYGLQLHEIKTNPYIELCDNQLHLFIKPETSQAYKLKLLTKWYYVKMQLCLPALFDKWQSTIKVIVNKVSIKHMKSRWGSCNPVKKHITLNLRLIEKPLVCLEYVIVHELVHLLEASHNQRFYALMDHYLPEWKQIKKQLESVEISV